jgi:hypothetical protein
MFPLVGGLALFVGACSANVGHAPPPLNKQLLTGKWKNSSDTQFVTGYEFAEDGTLKMIVQGMEQPVPARFTWSGERTLDMEFKVPEDIQRAYQAAAKAYKDQVRDRIKSGQLTDRAGPGMLSMVPDELPAEESLQVGLSDQPRLLILARANGVSQTFEQAD